MTSLAVIGCGNPVRGDDGAGIEVIRRLRTRAQREGVRLIDAGTAGMEVMYQVRDANTVVIVDACSSGSEPGAVFRLPGSEARTPVELGYTLHGLRWDHALYAGSKMFGDAFTSHTEVFLIEAQSLDYGESLSAAVERGVARVESEIFRLIDAHASPAPLEAWLRNGRLHLSSAAFDRHLRDCAAVALLARDGEWLLLPLHAGAGGLQIKVRNAVGDRVVEAQEFFRTQGLEDSDEIRRLQLLPLAERGVLRIAFPDDAKPG